MVKVVCMHWPIYKSTQKGVRALAHVHTHWTNYKSEMYINTLVNQGIGFRLHQNVPQITLVKKFKTLKNEKLYYIINRYYSNSDIYRKIWICTIFLWLCQTTIKETNLYLFFFLTGSVEVSWSLWRGNADDAGARVWKKLQWSKAWTQLEPKG